MTQPELPWVSLQPLVGGKMRALLAARIRLRPYAEQVQRQWGFNAAALLDEVHERQRLFLSGHHAGIAAASEVSEVEYSLGLRAHVQPAEAGLLQFYLLIGITISQGGEAHRIVHDYWNVLAAVFPHDYELEPITSETGLAAARGDRILDNRSTAELLEIRRFESAYQTGVNALYWLGAWQATPTSNEQIWRAMVGLTNPTMLAVNVHPVHMLNHERMVLSNQVAAAQLAATKATSLEARNEAQRVADDCQSRMERWRQPFLVQVWLASAAPIPSSFGRLVAAALCVPTAKISLTGARCISASSPVTAENWRAALLQLDACFGDDDQLDRNLLRLRYLVDVWEAQVPFRLPFPPRGHLPGVRFEVTEPSII